MSWPDLIVNLINKHLPNLIATAKGNLDQEFKNLQSTNELSKDEDMEPTQEKDNVYTHDIICVVFYSKELVSKKYLDQTGNFPVKS